MQKCNKRIVFSLITLFLFGTFLLHSEEITTASVFFKGVSDYYATLKDYEVDLDISVGREEMSCHSSYKKPNLLRMDFTKPQNEVIAFNGEMLTVYLPKTSSILQQAVQTGRDEKEKNLNFTSPEGLSLMTRYYIVAYEEGVNATPLESGSSEMVIKLVLSRRNTTEAFRTIRLAIDPNTKLIRRIVATQTNGEVFKFDFFDYKLNQNLSDARFIYDAPSSANNFNNFLFAD